MNLSHLHTFVVAQFVAIYALFGVTNPDHKSPLEDQNQFLEPGRLGPLMMRHFGGYWTWMWRASGRGHCQGCPGRRWRGWRCRWCRTPAAGPAQTRSSQFGIIPNHFFSALSHCLSQLRSTWLWIEKARMISSHQHLLVILCSHSVSWPFVLGPGSTSWKPALTVKRFPQLGGQTWSGINLFNWWRILLPGPMPHLR